MCLSLALITLIYTCPRSSKLGMIEPGRLQPQMAFHTPPIFKSVLHGPKMFASCPARAAEEGGMGFSATLAAVTYRTQLGCPCDLTSSIVSVINGRGNGQKHPFPPLQHPPLIAYQWDAIRGGIWGVGGRNIHFYSLHIYFFTPPSHSQYGLLKVTYTKKTIS